MLNKKVEELFYQKFCRQYGDSIKLADYDDAVIYGSDLFLLELQHRNFGVPYNFQNLLEASASSFNITTSEAAKICTYLINHETIQLPRVSSLYIITESDSLRESIKLNRYLTVNR